MSPVFLSVSAWSMTIATKLVRVLALSIQEHRNARRKKGSALPRWSPYYNPNEGFAADTTLLILGMAR